jgi:predicted kinase
MPPVLVALKGLPGTGKSTLAHALGTALGWPVLDKDDFMDPPDSALAYDLLFRLCGRLLAQGLSVVCDSPLMYASLYAQAQRAAAEGGGRLVILECHLAEAEHRRRVQRVGQRGLPAHKIATWPGMQAYMQRLAPYAIDVACLRLDLAQPLDDLVQQARGWLAGDAPDA